MLMCTGDVRFDAKAVPVSILRTCVTSKWIFFGWDDPTLFGYKQPVLVGAVVSAQEQS